MSRHLQTPVCDYLTKPKPRCTELPTDVMYRWDGEQVRMCDKHARLSLKGGYTRWRLKNYGV